MRANGNNTRRVCLVLGLGALLVPLAHGGARADNADDARTVCIAVQPNGQCPPGDEALEQIAEHDPGACPVQFYRSDPTQVMGQCCYEVLYVCPEEGGGCSVTAMRHP